MSNMFESYTPIRDVEFYQKEVEELKTGKPNPMRAINLHCRCVCPDLPDGMESNECTNSSCHFGIMKQSIAPTSKLPLGRYWVDNCEVTYKKSSKIGNEVLETVVRFFEEQNIASVQDTEQLESDPNFPVAGSELFRRIAEILNLWKHDE